jgi:arylsulfatase
VRENTKKFKNIFFICLQFLPLSLITLTLFDYFSRFDRYINQPVDISQFAVIGLTFLLYFFHFFPWLFFYITLFSLAIHAIYKNKDSWLCYIVLFLFALGITSPPYFQFIEYKRFLTGYSIFGFTVSICFITIFLLIIVLTEGILKIQSDLVSLSKKTGTEQFVVQKKNKIISSISWIFYQFISQKKLVQGILAILLFLVMIEIAEKNKSEFILGYFEYHLSLSVALIPLIFMLCWIIFLYSGFFNKEQQKKQSAYRIILIYFPIIILILSAFFYRLNYKTVHGREVIQSIVKKNSIALLSMFQGKMEQSVTNKCSRDNQKTSPGISPFTSEKEFFHVSGFPKLKLGKSKRHIIFIIVDSVRPDHLSCYRYSRKTHSNFIQKICDESLVFENAYSASTGTHGSLSSIYSQKPLSFTNGGSLEPQWEGFLSFYETTFVENLKKEKYNTTVISTKVHPYGPVYLGFRQGYNNYHLGETTDDKSVFEMAEMVVPELTSNKPQFIFFYLSGPHQYYKWYTGRLAGESERMFGEKMTDKYDYGIYYGFFWVEKFIKLLKKYNLYDNSILIITSDHGEAVGENGYYGHVFPVGQHVLKVPLIIRIPSIKGRKITQPVSQGNLFNWIFHYLSPSLEITAQKNFNSSWDILNKELGNSILNEVIGYGLQKSVIIDGTLKIVYDFALKDFSFYNLEKDPYEKIDISYNSKCYGCGKMIRKLKSYLKLRKCYQKNFFYKKFPRLIPDNF